MIGGELIKKRFASNITFLERYFIHFLYWLSLFLYKSIFSFFPDVEGIVLGGSRKSPFFRHGVSDLDVTVYFKDDVSDKYLRLANKIHQYFCFFCPIIEHNCIPIRVKDFKEYVQNHPGYHIWYYINKELQTPLKGNDPRSQLEDLPLPDEEFAIGLQLKHQWYLINKVYEDSSSVGMNLFFLRKSCYKMAKLREFQGINYQSLNYDITQDDLNYYLNFAIKITDGIYNNYTQNDAVEVQFDKNLFYLDYPSDVQSFMDSSGLKERNPIIMQPFYGFKNEIAMFIPNENIGSLNWIHSLQSYKESLKSKVLIYFVTSASAHLIFSSIKDDEHFYERFALDSQLDPITSTCTHKLLKSPGTTQTKVSTLAASRAIRMLYVELEYFKNEYLDNNQIFSLNSGDRDRLMIKAKQWCLLAESFLSSGYFIFNDMYQIDLIEPAVIQNEIKEILVDMTKFLERHAA